MSTTKKAEPAKNETTAEETKFEDTAPEAAAEEKKKAVAVKEKHQTPDLRYLYPPNQRFESGRRGYEHFAKFGIRICLYEVVLETTKNEETGEEETVEYFEPVTETEAMQWLDGVALMGNRDGDPSDIETYNEAFRGLKPYTEYILSVDVPSNMIEGHESSIHFVRKVQFEDASKEWFVLRGEEDKEDGERIIIYESRFRIGSKGFTSWKDPRKGFHLLELKGEVGAKEVTQFELSKLAATFQYDESGFVSLCYLTTQHLFSGEIRFDEEMGVIEIITPGFELYYDGLEVVFGELLGQKVTFKRLDEYDELTLEETQEKNDAIKRSFEAFIQDTEALKLLPLHFPQETSSWFAYDMGWGWGQVELPDGTKLMCKVYFTSLPTDAIGFARVEQGMTLYPLRYVYAYDVSGPRKDMLRLEAKDCRLTPVTPEEISAMEEAQRQAELLKQPVTIEQMLEISMKSQWYTEKPKEKPKPKKGNGKKRK